MSAELERSYSGRSISRRASALEVRERLRVQQAALRIEGTYDLADYATHRATNLNRSVKQQSQDNPGLEFIHREFENTAAAVANVIIYNYGTGR